MQIKQMKGDPIGREVKVTKAGSDHNGHKGNVVRVYGERPWIVIQFKDGAYGTYHNKQITVTDKPKATV